MAMAQSVAGDAAVAAEPEAPVQRVLAAPDEEIVPAELATGAVQAEIVPFAPALPVLFGPGSSPAWLCAYHGCGQGAPVWPFAGYDSPFKVEKISHPGHCNGANQQHKTSIDQCDHCARICLAHNQSLARRTGVGDAASTVNPMATSTGVFHRHFAPELCAKISALAHGLFSSYNAATQTFSYADWPITDAHSVLSGFDGFELVQGDYSAEQQGSS